MNRDEMTEIRLQRYSPMGFVDNLEVEYGNLWCGTRSVPFQRDPLRLKGQIRGPVADLAAHAACVRFSSAIKRTPRPPKLDLDLAAQGLLVAKSCGWECKHQVEIRMSGTSRPFCNVIAA